MALIVSAASGNFNAGATWAGGVVPTVGDEARASNGHTITITENANCDLISNLGTGNFVISNGVTLTANITSGSSTANSYVLRFLGASPAVSYVVGNVVYASINSASGINNAGTGTLTLTGNVSPGGLGSNAFGVNNTSSGVILITGNCTGATWTNSLCVNNNSMGSITITGNVLGGNNTGSPGVTNATTGPVTIVGNVSGGTVSPGLLNNSTGTITLTGELTASTAAHAVTSTNASSVVRVSGSFIYASNGLVPVNTTKFILLTTPTTAKTRYALNGAGTFVDMFTADNTGLGPATNHVRSGVTYSGMTGTLAVPLPSQVAVGVATDNTVGTAVLTGADIAAAVWGADTRTLTAGAGISASDVWSHASRTLTTSSGPTAVEIRQELDSNSTKLANLDATVSSRLAPSGTLATVTNLTNAPTVPSASAIASQVRTELATELARVDAAITTRATPANIPTDSITAIKGKTDLLNTTRLAQVSTTEILGNLLAQANS